MVVKRTREKYARKLGFVRTIAQSADEGTGANDTEHAAGEFLGALMTASGRLDTEPAPPTSPTGTDLDQFGDALGPDLDLERNASASAWSMSDAVMRLDWLLARLTEHRRFFFRGQVNIEWPLESSAKRLMVEYGEPLPSLGVVSHEEGDRLYDFQNRFLGGQTWASDDDRRRFSGIPLSSSSWWSLMQHYEGGTRLLDISSTFLEALYFACVDWNGTIDESTFGVVHLFGERNGRIMYDERDTDFADRTPAQWSKLFDLNHPDTVRFYFPSPFVRNERIKAQRGAFVFWPDLEKPYPSQAYYLRIHPDAKRNIAAELFRIGIQPRLLVHGPHGEEAYQRLCVELNTEARYHD